MVVNILLEICYLQKVNIVKYFCSQALFSSLSALRQFLALSESDKGGLGNRLLEAA
jgi:hypothetical protein